MPYKHMRWLRENVFCFFLETKPCLMLIKHSLFYCKVSQLQKQAFYHRNFEMCLLKIVVSIKSRANDWCGGCLFLQMGNPNRNVGGYAVSLLSYTKCRINIWWEIRCSMTKCFMKITSNFSQDIVPSFGIARIYVLLYFYPHSQY